MMRRLLYVLLGVLLSAWPGWAVASTVPAKPLPPVDLILKRVTERAKQEAANDRSFDLAYTYQRAKLTEHRNGSGRLLEHEQKTSRHDPAMVPVKHRVAPPAQQPQAKPGEMRGKAVEKKDILLNSDLFSRFRFTLLGREMLNGRPTLVLEFRPASDNLPERNFKDRFINKAAGRAWVDEQDYAVVKADLHLTEPVKVLGGLVGVVNAFNYRFTRQRTPEDLWFTREVIWRLVAREVVLHRTIDYHEETTDVRRQEPGVSPDRSGFRKLKSQASGVGK